MLAPVGLLRQGLDLTPDSRAAWQMKTAEPLVTGTDTATVRHIPSQIENLNIFFCGQESQLPTPYRSVRDILRAGNLLKPCK